MGLEWPPGRDLPRVIGIAEQFVSDRAIGEGAPSRHLERHAVCCSQDFGSDLSQVESTVGQANRGARVLGKGGKPFVREIELSKFVETVGRRV
jgi:hypothetical protein